MQLLLLLLHIKWLTQLANSFATQQPAVSHLHTQTTHNKAKYVSRETKHIANKKAPLLC
jgi:hypothetical protein